MDQVKMLYPIISDFLSFIGLMLTNGGAIRRGNLPLTILAWPLFILYQIIQIVGNPPPALQ